MTKVPKPDRLPVQPLLALYPSKSVADFVAMSGIDQRQFYRWIKDGLTLDAAERLAESVGLHPAEIWTEAWRIGEGQVAKLNAFLRKERRNAAEEKAVRARKSHANAKTRWRAKWPEEKREKHALYMRQYREEKAEALRVTRREYYLKTRGRQIEGSRRRREAKRAEVKAVEAASSVDLAVAGEQALADA